MIRLINSHLYQLLEEISKILCFIYIFFYFMDISKAISFGTKLILVSIWSLRSLRRLQGKVQRLLRQCENYFPRTSSDRSHCYDNGGWNGLEFKLNGKKNLFVYLEKIQHFKRINYSWLLRSPLPNRLRQRACEIFKSTFGPSLQLIFNQDSISFLLGQ